MNWRLFKVLLVVIGLVVVVLICHKLFDPKFAEETTNGLLDYIIRLFTSK